MKFTSVEITASEAELERRLGSTQRQQFKKLTDVALYRQLRDRGVFTSPLIPRTDLRIDTGTIASAEAAAQIARQFAL